MTRTTRTVAAVTALLIAVLLNSFYVDYVLGINAPNRRGFLVSWRPMPSQREAYVDGLAKREVRAEKITLIQSPSKDAIDAMRWRHTREFCRWPGLDFSQMTCTKKFAEPRITWTKRVIPAFDYAQARRKVEASESLNRLEFGMVSARDVAGSGEPSRSALAKSYWLGIIAPVLLLAVSIGLMLSVLRARGPNN